MEWMSRPDGSMSVNGQQPIPLSTDAFAADGGGPAESSQGEPATTTQPTTSTPTAVASINHVPPPPPPPPRRVTTTATELFLETKKSLLASSSSSTQTTESVESTSQLLKGFWKKTVDNTTTAHALWKNRLQQHRSTSASSSATAPAASTTGASPLVKAKAPLINAAQLLEQASLSPANQDGDDATATAVVQNGDNEEEEESLVVPVEELASSSITARFVKAPSSVTSPTNGAAASASDAAPTEHTTHEETDHPRGASAPRSRSSSSDDDEEEDDDDFDEDDEDEDGDTTSYVSSSVYSNSQYSSTDTHKFSALQWAAASVVDSVQAGYFRGRYASSSNSNRTNKQRDTTFRMSGPSSLLSAASPSRAVGVIGGVTGGTLGATTATSNQTSRILGSAHAAHLRDLLSKLAPYEYIMFLGKGMLGVNLKQSFLHKVGVYVDYLIPHGAADQSKLIHVGDLLLQVGEMNVTKQTILAVPQQIANAPRPLQLIWATGTKPSGYHHLNYVELAVAHLQRWKDDNNEHDDDGMDLSTTSTHKIMNRTRSRGSSWSSIPGSPSSRPFGNTSTTRKSINGGASDDASATTEVPNADDVEEKKLEGESLHDAPSVVLDDDLLPPQQHHHDQQQQPNHHEPCEGDVSTTSMIEHPNVDIPAITSVEGWFHPELPSLEIRQAYYDVSVGRSTGFSVQQLCQQAATDDPFRNLLQHAFVLCALDERRFPFLTRHLGQLEEQEAKDDDDNDNDRAQNSPSALLMLFVEMVSYADLFHVTPLPRRQQIAHRIAYKFFLPTRLGNELIPPMFDFHQIVPDATLRELEASLQSDSDRVSRDIFADFAWAAMESLSSHPFLTFLVSPDCARMRAYLRNTTLFVHVPLHTVLDALTNCTDANVVADSHAQNYFCHILLFLLCQTDKEGYGEHDEILATGNGARCQDSAASLCAALYIRRQLQSAILQASKDQPETLQTAIVAWERLWETFVAPHVGALSLAPLSGEAAGYLAMLVARLTEIRNEGGTMETVASSLCEDSLLQIALMLADEIVYGYATNLHSKFRQHKFHEWLCIEFAKARSESEQPDGAEVSTSSGVPPLPAGCVKRLLQKATFPVGIAPHKPFVQSEAETSKESKIATDVAHVTAECAVVIGTQVGLFDSNPTLLDDTNDMLRRYACESLHFNDTPGPNALTLEDIPPTLESYAVVPSLAESSSRPFRQYRDGQWFSSDGWEVSLVNFRIPRGDSSDENEVSSVYGVSLTFRSYNSSVAEGKRQTELVYDPDLELTSDSMVVETSQNSDSLVTKVRLPLETPVFNEKLAETPWSERVTSTSPPGSQVTVGLALLSHQNVILAMRETLDKLLEAFSVRSSGFTCGALVDILGNFAHDEIEDGTLQGILGSFLTNAAQPWLERPISLQKHNFEQLAGRQLLSSLPPIPLALTFVTALLEQKIVIASSRRSLLLSASEAISKMLHPLRWCHLLVPRVPAALAADLLQYPAPFILGIPSEDPGMIDLIRDLPDDVTLVDLDVGRVLLAQSFSHVEFGRGTPNNPKKARALRSQVLYLAQALGGVLGSVSDPEAWHCDRPLFERKATDDVTPFDRICAVCGEFLEELLAGTASCCFWLEESSSSPDTARQEPTVVFDEDRFFHIKSMRQRHGFRPLFDPTGASNRPSLALSLSDFELVLEVLMHCQSINAYIANCNKETMAYCIHQ